MVTLYGVKIEQKSIALRMLREAVEEMYGKQPSQDTADGKQEWMRLKLMEWKKKGNSACMYTNQWYRGITHT